MYDSSEPKISTSNKCISPVTLKAEKRFLIWLNSQPTSPLTFAENLVFSVIARKPASKRSLAKLTGLCRIKTIPKVIDKLSELGLCECKDGRYTALEPNAQQLPWWLTWDNRDAKRWQDKLTYFKIYRPNSTSGLTTRQNALFCKILNFPSKLPSYYATCLGLPRRTVFDQLSKLRSLGLISKEGCRIPESVPDQWLPKPAAQSLIAPSIRKFFDDLKDGWLMPGVAIKKMEQSSDLLSSHFGHTSKYLRRYWIETFRSLNDADRIEAFVQESGKITGHVIATGRTRKYLKTTTALVVKQLAAWPLDRIMYWEFDPATLFKTL